MRAPRYTAGVAVLAALLLVPCGAAFAEDAPPVVDPPVVTPPAITPPIETPPEPRTAMDVPPLVSSTVEWPASTMDILGSYAGSPSTPPLTGMWAMTDEERFAYITAQAQAEMALAVEQFMAGYRSGKNPTTGFSPQNNVSAPTGTGATATEASWTPLSKPIVGRQLATAAAGVSGGRALSSRLTLRYDAPNTTAVVFIVVNGSSTSTTATVTWQSATGKVSDRVLVAAGATVQSTLVLPTRQDLSAAPGRVTATFTSTAASRDEISFVALTSPALPQDLPDARGYSTAPPR